MTKLEQLRKIKETLLEGLDTLHTKMKERAELLTKLEREYYQLISNVDFLIAKEEGARDD